MCGICGFSGPNNTPVLEKMTENLTHRGPDSLGFWEEESVSLGFRRLSVVDIKSGNQPAVSNDQNIVAVFNGEIYNHLELRIELSKKGYVFNSHHSDAEVIPYLYSEYGADFPKYLDGMFAIALYDKTRDLYILCRDHAGIKPLYYSIANNQIVFGSEIKSLLRHPDISKNPDFESIYHYFSFKNIPSPRSAFSSIKQLIPGELLIFSGGKAQSMQWWTLPTRQVDYPESDIKTMLRKSLEEIVCQHSNADVEIGAFLSGGLDSSAIVALLSRHCTKPRTFTLTYDEPFVNKEADRQSAQIVSKLFGTDHYEYVLTEKVFWGSMEDIVKAFDEPFSGVTSTYFLTQLISKHVKVALSGDGADELFGSYLPHRVANPLAEYEQLNENARASWSHTEFSTDFLENLVQKGDGSQRRLALTLWDDETKHSIFTPEFSLAARDFSSIHLVQDYYKKPRALSPLSRALLFDCKTQLPDQVLAFTDRLSMAHSVEVRPPFLDRRMMELAFTIKDNLKIKDGNVKWILKEAIRDLLPQSIVERKKEGFVIPVNHWLERDKYKKIDEYINESVVKKTGILDFNAVKRIIGRAKKGDYKSLLRTWNIMMFCSWSEYYL